MAERIFAALDVTHFLLEYDTPRAGSFAPLRAVRKNKGVVLGLMSSKVSKLESTDERHRPSCHKSAVRFCERSCRQSSVRSG